MPFYYTDRDEKNVEKKLYGRKASHVMKTDIKETDNGYELVVDLPGFKKDEIHLELNHGYLTISAEKSLEKDKENIANKKQPSSSEVMVLSLRRR